MALESTIEDVPDTPANDHAFGRLYFAKKVCRIDSQACQRPTFVAIRVVRTNETPLGKSLVSLRSAFASRAD